MKKIANLGLGIIMFICFTFWFFANSTHMMGGFAILIILCYLIKEYEGGMK